MHKKSTLVWFGLAVVMLIAAISAVIFSACGPQNLDRHYQALEAEGFTQIDFTERLWSCGRDYDQNYRFVATNPVGHRVTGAVCCGYYNGCSIHWGM